MTMQKNGTSPFESGRVQYLPIDRICPNPAQPRRIFDRDALQELAASIAQHGLLQPVSVRRRDGGYELIAGERRLRAAKLAGLERIPCILMHVDEPQSGMLALVENLQRRDLDYLEEAEGISRLMRLYGLNQDQVAHRLGKSQSAIANKLRLLRHTPPVREALRQAGLSERHARALLRLPGEEERLAAIAVIARKGWNVAQTEAYVEAVLARSVQPRQGMRKLITRDVRLFLNAVSHHLDTLRSAGIASTMTREDSGDEIVLTIRLPKRIGQAQSSGQAELDGRQTDKNTCTSEERVV
ncbi:MAG: ParB/RepB/Spo0J family partition protein [Oscillospiraceae bacterium]|nr:ParB/RepB/Spo0J family partition protein [Oscillospiraceae bacterium]MBQ2153636.1 ParB/RepB/Spo0J family partition protein [Oscillospiraceae bacterium]